MNLSGVFHAVGKVSWQSVLLLLAGSVVTAGEPEKILVRDRQGVALVRAGSDSQHPQYPYRALAPQLLTAVAGGTPANPLNLTIDARMQFIAERALRAVSRGAVVIVDPRTGDLLAAASVPSFDPNTLDDPTRATLAADPTHPLSNRVFRAATPGSTFLPVTSLAGLRLGLHFAERTFKCTGAVKYGSQSLNCWIGTKEGGHGDLRLDEAFKASCGPFFHQYGNAVGIDGLHSTGKLLGLGEPSGLALPDESAGLLPNPAWQQKIYPNDRWTAWHTASVAIGQGATSTTPLQLAMVAATLGSGGKAYAPRLNLKAPVQLRADLCREGWTPETIEVVRLAMWKTVNDSGIGQRAKVPGVEIAGRIGTAQSWRESEKDNHTWFIGFAPYAEPTLAICVKVEGSKSGGNITAPMAGRIFAECLASPTEPRVAALAPAVGNLETIDSLEQYPATRGLASPYSAPLNP